MELRLRHGTALFDDEDAGRLAGFPWYSAKFSKPGQPVRYYVAAQICGRTVYMHRLVLNVGPRTEIDHVNMDGLDNRRANLRRVNRSQNMANSKSRGGASRYKGVSRARKRWGAWIMVAGKSRNLGHFDTEEEAALAYNAAAVQAWGAHARLNEVPGDVTARGDRSDISRFGG